MKTEGNEPAYPVEKHVTNPFLGLTKREAFAMAAMQGVLANDFCRPGDASRDAMESHYRNVARNAYRHADALIAALNQDSP